MRDGTRLAMRVSIPDGAEGEPVPVVMEYGGRDRDANFLPSYGIAYARPEIRGIGNSEGVLLGEYLQQEQDDGVELIAWLASQSWCNGSVGMRGLSWSGITALQIAAMAPPPLKAIMPHCATVNRYTDSTHYIGGLLSKDNFAWGTFFRLMMASPPDPAIVGEDRWRNMWLERLKAAAPILARWMEHQRYDEFWQHGSVQTDYSRIRCPVYAVGGQVDGFRDFIPRLLSNLQVPRKGLMGPWGHCYPHEAVPGPGLEWEFEELRWWHEWLLGEDTGIMEEPMLRVYMESQTASEVWPQDVPGRWIAEHNWPSKRINEKTFFLNENELSVNRGIETTRLCESRETIGLTRPAWMPFDMQRELPREQSPDDERSVLFDSAPLEADVELLGNAKTRVRLSSDQRVASLAVRVNEVTPEGKSWNVTYGLLNLTHRDSHKEPSPLEPGRFYDVEVSCYFTAHRFTKGNRIRVAISESLWPLAWPSPHPVKLSIVTGASTLSLPIRPSEKTELLPQMALIRSRVESTAENRPVPTLQAKPDGEGRVSVETRVNGSVRSFSIQEGAPNSCVWRGEQRWSHQDLNISLEAAFELSSTAETFHLLESFRATEGDSVILEREWIHDIERDLM